MTISGGDPVGVPDVRDDDVFFPETTPVSTKWVCTMAAAFNRRDFLKTAAAAIPSLLAASHLRGAEPANRPNFLVIVADDMGYSDAGCYGGEIATPNLDRLAANGLRFNQFYCTARCWPSRSCILTGYYAQQVRMDPPRGRLPAWTRVLPHYLKPAGYRCYHSGKWHLMGAPKAVADGGFDRSYKLDDHDHNFYPKNHLEDDKPLPPVKKDAGYYTATYMADHAIRCLKEHAEKYANQPFYEYLAFTVPHFPLQAPQEDIDRYRDKFLEGWDSLRQRKAQRMRDIGLVNCACRRSIPMRRAIPTRRCSTSSVPARSATRPRGRTSATSRSDSRRRRWRFTPR